MSAENSGARKRLLFMLSLTTTFFFIEIIVGYVTNSMALVADSFHMLSDLIALVIAYISVLMSPKKWSKNTFGWARAEVLGALINAVFLCALCFSILVESVKRFYNVQKIHEPVLILGVGLAGLLVNVIGLFLFAGHGGGHGHSHGGGGGHKHSHGGDTGHGHSHDGVQSHDHKHSDGVSKKDEEKKKLPSSSEQMNMHGVFLHVLADALGSVIVCISALIIWLTDWWIRDYVDPFLSVIMVCLITYSTWPLLAESAMILLQTVPTHIEVNDLRKKLLSEIKGVIAVHEFHVWQLAGEKIIASAHIRCQNLSDYMKIAEKVKEFFHNEGIHSTTIQPEFVDLDFQFRPMEDNENCALDCPEKDSCASKTCCESSRSSPDPLANNNRDDFNKDRRTFYGSNMTIEKGIDSTGFKNVPLDSGDNKSVNLDIGDPKQTSEKDRKDQDPDDRGKFNDGFYGP